VVKTDRRRSKARAVASWDVRLGFVEVFSAVLRSSVLELGLLEVARDDAASFALALTPNGGLMLG